MLFFIESSSGISYSIIIITIVSYIIIIITIASYIIIIIIIIIIISTRSHRNTRIYGHGALHRSKIHAEQESPGTGWITSRAVESHL